MTIHAIIPILKFHLPVLARKAELSPLHASLAFPQITSTFRFSIIDKVNTISQHVSHPSIFVLSELDCGISAALLSKANLSRVLPGSGLHPLDIIQHRDKYI